MARITVEDCLEKIDNQYDLVLLAKERTSQLNSGAEMLVEKDNDKNTVIALREIGEAKVSPEELKKSAIARLRKEPNESDEEVIEDEISNDDFEKEYKGEVSKSGVAILPSKRMRKVPVQNNSTVTEKQDNEESALKLTEEVKEVSEDLKEEKPLSILEEEK